MPLGPAGTGDAGEPGDVVVGPTVDDLGTPLADLETARKVIDTLDINP